MLSHLLRLSRTASSRVRTLGVDIFKKGLWEVWTLAEGGALGDSVYFGGGLYLRWMVYTLRILSSCRCFSGISTFRCVTWVMSSYVLVRFWNIEL